MKFFETLFNSRTFYLGVLFLVVLKFSIYGQYAENTVILVKPHSKSNSLMINRQGKIVKEFELNELIRVDENGKDNILSMLYLINYTSHDFNKGPLVVGVNNEWSLYDINGKRITTIDKKYSYLGYANGGLFLATKINEDNPKKFTSVYLNASGSEVFDGKKLWGASHFNGNHAIAREEDGIGAWIILNKSSMTHATLPAPLSERIEAVTSISGSYFVVYQNRKYSWGEILADSLGNIVFDPEMVTGIKSLNFKTMKGSICVYGKNNELYFFRDLKTQIEPNFKITSVDGISARYIYLNKRTSTTNLYDHHFQPVTLPLNTHQVFMVNKLDDKYLAGSVTDTLSKKTEYRVYDANTLQLLGSSDRNFEDIIADVWVGVDGGDSFNKKLSELYNFSNSQLFKLPTSHRMFRGIAATKGYAPTDIHHLEVTDNEDITRLKEFKNLRTLQFFDFNFTSLPSNIKKLKSLKTFDLTLCRSLTALPAWFPELTSIQFIDIVDCKSIRNIESVLLKLPKLKEVTTMNYDFDDNFLLRMQKPGARFKVNNIYGTSLDEAPMLEEVGR